MLDRSPQRYDLFGSAENLCAAGAVIASWNACELTLGTLLQRVLDIDWRTAQRTFELLSNAARIELLELEGRRLASDEEFALVKVFTKNYAICRENRNLIAHGAFSNAGSGKLVLARTSHRDRITRTIFQISSRQMYDLADEIAALSRFGMNLADAIEAARKSTPEPCMLPEPPPPPRRLTRPRR